MSLHTDTQNGAMDGTTRLLRQAVFEADAGDRKRAQTLLRIVCRRDPNNVTAWLRLASVADSVREEADCLRNVLRISPHNHRAKLQLERCKITQGDTECPFCNHEHVLVVSRCFRCRAVISLQLEMFDNSENVDELQLQRAVKYLKSMNSPETYANHYYLAIAYLNLYQSELALDHLRAAHRLRPGAPDLASAIEGLRKRKLVLVVDDSLGSRTTLGRTLERNWFRTILAASGAEALMLLNEKEISAVILDSDMPVMDGYTVCHLMRAHTRATDVPVILLTGEDGVFAKIKTRLAKATGYLTKPPQPSLLITALEKANCTGSRPLPGTSLLSKSATAGAENADYA